MRFPRYPFVAIAPVSPRTTELVDVTCSSCGMIHAAVSYQTARQRAAEHRDLHLVVTFATVTIALACGMVLWYAAGLLGLTQEAGAIVGATIGLVASARVLSPARRSARQTVRGRSDA